MARLAAPYVAGETTEDALTQARELARLNLSASLDFFGEQVTDPAQADAVAEAYRRWRIVWATDAPPGTWLSVDLSHLGIYRRCSAPPVAGSRRSPSACPTAPACRSARRRRPSPTRARRRAQRARTARGSRRPSRPTSVAVPEDVPGLAAAGIGVRLVKGAYLEDPRDALPHGDATDLAYLQLAEQLGELDAEVHLATHHGLLREACRRVLPRAPVEMLLGVRGAEASALAAAGVPVRLYVPFGPDWFRYAMRRLAEARGA